VPSTVSHHRPEMSRKAFALLGDGTIAYIKAVRSEEVGFRYPEAPLLAPGFIVFVLHAADGTPIVVADTPEAAAADALRHHLEPVSVN